MFFFNLASSVGARFVERRARLTLIKMITKLSTFEGKSKFRTWLYKIAANHVINVKRRKVEQMVTSFSQYGKELDEIPDTDLADSNTMPADLKLIVEEAKIGCMTGMLLCLQLGLRNQRVRTALQCHPF